MGDEIMGRKVKDGIMQAITYISSSLSIIVLVTIIGYLLIHGVGLLNWDFLTSPYHSKVIVVDQIEAEKNTTVNYQGDGYYSVDYDVALIDTVDNHHNKLIVIDYVGENSPFKQAAVNDSLESMYLEINGHEQFISKIRMQDAKNTLALLHSSTAVNSFSYQIIGGGIYGSLITTLLLIVVSIALVLPIGIGSALYLTEYAKATKINKLIKSGIEILTGVPSIIFGLMGVTVLYPLTTYFGATSTSILLGSFTMVVILLPIVIRSCEEALLVVPQTLRDGSLSLGATKTQTIFKVVLPCALDGILTGVLLSIGRVIGETAALVYTTSTVINDAPNLLGQGTSLSLMIWTVMSGEQPNFELASAISLIILIIVILVNIIVKVIGRRYNRRFV